MPKTKNGIPHEVCVNFCQYYKPGKNEELACRGFVVVQGLLQQGRTFSQKRPGQRSSPGADAINTLKGKVCAVCPFREEDCDFILTNGTAEPCGGFALLSHLLGCGELTLEDI